jgi:hypothetical protein
MAIHERWSVRIQSPSVAATAGRSHTNGGTARHDPTGSRILLEERAASPPRVLSPEFPELKAAGSLSPLLVFREYSIRSSYGDKPSLIEYRKRFPEQYHEVERLAEQQTFDTVIAPRPSSPLSAQPGDT